MELTETGTTTVGVNRLAGPEWWERAGRRVGAWREERPGLALRLSGVRVAAMWISLVAIGVTIFVLPETRPGLRLWLFAYVLLLDWFLIARTKSISWRLVGILFALCVPWSVVIALVSTWLSSDVGEIFGGVFSAGARTAIAGITEESLKLLPLAALAFAAPGLVRRFAAVDWLLIGFTSGLRSQRPRTCSHSPTPPMVIWQLRNSSQVIQTSHLLVSLAGQCASFSVRQPQQIMTSRHGEASVCRAPRFTGR